MPPSLEEKMKALLNRRKSLSSYRTLTTFPPTSTDFSSNDFLSLSTSPLLRNAYLAELNNHPSFRLGSTGSRLLDGNSTYAENLENTIANFHRSESALLFNSGFDANEGFFACVPQEGDIVVFDEMIHASVREGIRLSRSGEAVSFLHNDVQSLKCILKELKLEYPDVRDGRRNVFIAVESLYSMDGDLAPLKEILDVVEKELGGKEGNGLVVVDEAHSTGVYGENGRGFVNWLGLEGKVFARLITFGKALGCNGAAILCSKLTREYLINYARPLIYTTAMGFPSLAAIKVVYNLLQAGQTDPLQHHLTSLIAYTHNLLLTLQPLLQNSKLLGIPKEMPKSPIFSLQMENPRSLALYCQMNGSVVRAIMPPTVPRGSQRVRICLHAGNSSEDVDVLVRRIGEWLVLERDKVGSGRGTVKAVL